VLCLALFSASHIEKGSSAISITRALQEHHKKKTTTSRQSSSSQQTTAHYTRKDSVSTFLSAGKHSNFQGLPRYSQTSAALQAVVHIIFLDLVSDLVLGEALVGVVGDVLRIDH